MIVKVGNRIKWTDTQCCAYKVVKVVHVWKKFNACGVILEKIGTACNCYKGTALMFTGDEFFTWAEDPFVTFVKEVLDAGTAKG